MKHRRFYRSKNTVMFKTVCIVIVILIAVLLTDAKLRPTIYDLAALEAYAVAEKTINSAVEKVLIEKGVAYSDLVCIGTAENGAISGITTDIVKMNLFKSQITDSIDKAFEQTSQIEVSVPFGSACGISLFAGCGPNINMNINMTAATSSDFENIFQSVGINQTQHSIMLNVGSLVTLILPRKRITKKAETSFCVAQTVIVGSVPDVMVE